MENLKKIVSVSMTVLFVILGLSFFNILDFTIDSALIYISVAAISLYLISEFDFEFSLGSMTLGVFISLLLVFASVYKLNPQVGLVIRTTVSFVLPFFALIIRNRLVKQ